METAPAPLFIVMPSLPSDRLLPAPARVVVPVLLKTSPSAASLPNVMVSAWFKPVVLKRHHRWQSGYRLSSCRRYPMFPWLRRAATKFERRPKQSPVQRWREGEATILRAFDDFSWKNSEGVRGKTSVCR